MFYGVPFFTGSLKHSFFGFLMVGASLYSASTFAFALARTRMADRYLNGPIAWLMVAVLTVVAYGPVGAGYPQLARMVFLTVVCLLVNHFFGFQATAPPSDEPAD